MRSRPRRVIFDARNAFNEVLRQLIMNAVVINAPGLARYLPMVNVCFSWLIAGLHLIRFLQGTRQGDPLGTKLFSFVIQSIIDEMQAFSALDYNI